MRTNPFHPTLENHGRQLANFAAAQEIRVDAAVAAVVQNWIAFSQ